MKNLQWVLLLTGIVLCITAAYALVQESRLLTIPTLSLEEILHIPLYLGLLAWGIAVLYGSATLPDHFMERFARYSPRYEGAAARAVFSILGAAMVIYALVSLDHLLRPR